MAPILTVLTRKLKNIYIFYTLLTLMVTVLFLKKNNRMVNVKLERFK